MTTFPKVYTVNGPSSTSSSTLPSWLTVKPRSTKTSSGHRKRVKTQRTLGQLELVQDLAFPESAIKIKTTEDGHYAIGTGCYKPMMKVWDLDHLTVKFERVTDAENVDFVILSSDWTKTLHLQRDRSLALHTQSGLHHSIRLPTYGRSLAYHSPSADALVAATGTDVFRFNLEQGRYMTPLSVAQGWNDPMEDQVEGVNVVDVNSRHGLWSFGLDGGGGVVEFWDPRSRSALTRLSLPASTLLPVQPFDPDSLIARPPQKLSVTALSSHPTDGLSLAVGTSSGHTLLYDLRSPTPFAVKDQGYGEPMKSVEWLRGGGAQEDAGRVVSADSKVIKIWSKDDPSANQLSLHPPSPLVDLHPVPHSGLLFVACNAAPLSTYYIPEIGPAPRWAGFLDSVTEELADDVSSGLGKGAYSDFKFIDKDELETLTLTHLIGTPALKPYMHGYFLSLKLYTTARLIANPTSYAEHRDKIVAQRLAAKAESRIRARKDQPKVNKALAERLRKVEEREEALGRRKREKEGLVQRQEDQENGGGNGKGEGNTADTKGGLLVDPRFKEIFEDPEFEVDEQSREFALLNPATANKNASRRTAVQVEEDESDRSSSGLGSDEEDEDEVNIVDDGSVSEESDDGDLLQYDPRRVKPTAGFNSHAGSSRQQPRLVVGNNNARSSLSETFGQRLQSRSSNDKGKSRGAHAAATDNVLSMRRSTDGGMEMSFIPSGKSKSGNREEDEYSGGTRRVGGIGGGGKGGGKVERFGAGMEKGEVEREMKGDDRGGRSQRRHIGRSASKNAFRKR